MKKKQQDFPRFWSINLTYLLDDSWLEKDEEKDKLLNNDCLASA